MKRNDHCHAFVVTIVICLWPSLVHRTHSYDFVSEMQVCRFFGIGWRYLSPRYVSCHVL
jgi:hypothetical protein